MASIERDLNVAIMFSRIISVSEGIDKSYELSLNMDQAYKEHTEQISKIKRDASELIDVDTLIVVLKNRLDAVQQTGGAGYSKHPRYLWDKKIYDFFTQIP